MKINALGSSSGGNQSPDALRALAVAAFAAGFPLVNQAEFFPIVGNADTVRNVDPNITAGSNRAIGEDYAQTRSVNPDYGSVALKIYGDQVKTDIANTRRGLDVADQRARDLQNFSGSLGRRFMDALINDTLGAKTFSGLKEQCAALSRTYAYTENSGLFPNGNSATERKQQDAFFEFFDEVLEDISGGPSVIILGGKLKARFKSVGRGFMSTTNVADIYGANQTVSSYSDVPLINAGYKADRTTSVIPYVAETGTDIYVIRFGEAQDTSIATNVGLDVRDQGVVGPSLCTLVEFDVALSIMAPKTVAHISGIKL